MIERLLREKKILVCVGSGGVGKTTLSASLAIAAARLGRRVLVMTIDPSKRLKVALGIDGHEAKVTRIPNQNYPGEVHALLLDAEAIFKEFISSSSSDSRLADRLLKNRLYQQLSTTLSGSQEFTSLLQLSKIASDDRFDLIILDTPPAQHAVDFLEAPQKINALFQDRIVRWFIGDEDGAGFIQRIIAGGTRTVLSALERITGSHFMKELNDFFSSVRSVQAKIGQKTQLAESLLRAPTTAFILVTGFDSAKLHEGEELNNYLRASGFKLELVIINRAFVELLSSLPNADGLGSPETKLLDEEYRKWMSYHAEREKLYAEYSNKWRQTLPVIRIPDLNRDMTGLSSLEVIADEMVEAFNRGNVSNRAAELRPR